MKKYIAYYRVSRKEQQISGLGLLAQKSSVEKFVTSQNGIILNEYTEIETGTNKRERIEIHKAIQYAKAEGAILAIANLSRLARNVNFVSSLMDAGVEFLAVDMPSLTILQYTYLVHWRKKRQSLSVPEPSLLLQN